MKKSLLIISFLISALALPVAAQHTFVKNSPHFSAPAKADEAKTMAMSHVVASYYTAASEATNNCDNYYLVVSDKTNAVFNSAEGTIVATNANVAAIDLYAPAGTGTELPEGTFKAGEGSLYYDADYSYTTKYGFTGKPGKEVALKGDVTVKKGADNSYTVTFADANGVQYTYTGTLSFVDMNTGTTVYPQIPTDVNTTFTGGMAYYHGNLMESNTGNIYINLFDCDFDPETGNMKGTGFNLAICAFNRLFGDPKQATIIPGTYTVARNFKSETYFPGMEIDYNGMTVLMGTYIKRRKTVTGSDSDYDYAYITDGTVVITDGDEEGTFNFTIDCTTDRGHKVTGTAKNIKFNIVDVSDDKEKYVESNLDRDVKLNLDYIKKARVYFLGNQNGVNIYTVDLGSPSGKDGDEGDLLRMEFQTKPGTAYLPSGTYELMENDHLWTNLYAPYKMTRGYFDNVGGRTGTRYEHFEKGRYCVVDSFAFVYSGRVGVEQLANEEYKFTIDLADGKGFQIQGEWSGPVELNYDPSTSLGKTVGAETETVKFVGNNMLLVSGATKGERLSVYTVGGQHVLSADATKPVDVAALRSGVYVVRTTNGVITKIVKR